MYFKQLLHCATAHNKDNVYFLMFLLRLILNFLLVLRSFEVLTLQIEELILGYEKSLYFNRFMDF